MNHYKSQEREARLMDNDGLEEEEVLEFTSESILKYLKQECENPMRIIYGKSGITGVLDY
jgi:hypothetical protein